MFRVRDLYGALGVMLFLIALYLVLTRYIGATRVIGETTGGLVDLFRALQGR